MMQFNGRCGVGGGTGSGGGGSKGKDEKILWFWHL